MIKSNIRLGIVGNSSQVRRFYLEHLRNREDLPCEVNVAWVSGCLCSAGKEINSCPFHTPNVPSGLRLSFDPDNDYPCNATDNFTSWKRHLADNSVDAILVSLPNQLHFSPVSDFLKSSVSVAVDKPPVVSSAEAMYLVQLAELQKLTFVTLAQRRFEEVYQKMAQIVRSGDMGQIQLINLLFVHGWTPERPNWRSKYSLAGGGVLLDSIFNCLDVILWLLQQTANPPRPISVHSYWRPQFPNDPDTVELQITVGVKFNDGCLLNIGASSCALGRESIDENIKIFGTEGVLRYQRDMVSRRSMAAGELTFQSKEKPDVCEKLMAAGQGQGLRYAPFHDFLRCVHNPDLQPLSPVKDSIVVLKIIESAYLSASNGGIPIEIK